MHHLPVVAEFKGLLQTEYAALAALPWQEISKSNVTDCVYLAVKGRIRYGKRMVMAGQLTGILPFVVNQRQQVEFSAGANCLGLPTEKLARFFLSHPAALRSFTGVLQQEGRELLTPYKKHPAVVVIENNLLSWFKEANIAEAVYFNASTLKERESLKLAWAEFYYEALTRNLKAIVVAPALDQLDFFGKEASLVICREPFKANLPPTPAILLLLTPKNETALLTLAKSLIDLCSGNSAVRFVCDTAYHTGWLKELGEKRKELLFLQGTAGFLYALQVIGENWEETKIKKVISSTLLQPIYPKKTFFDKKYTEKKLRKIWGTKDLIEIGIVTAGTSWLASGKLAVALADAIYPPGATTQLLAEPLFSPNAALYRMLRLGIRQGIYQKAGEQLTLGADFPAQLHETFPEKLGRRGIEFQWLLC